MLEKKQTKQKTDILSKAMIKLYKQICRDIHILIRDIIALLQNQYGTEEYVSILSKLLQNQYGTEEYVSVLSKLLQNQYGTEEYVSVLSKLLQNQYGTEEYVSVLSKLLQNQYGTEEYVSVLSKLLSYAACFLNVSSYFYYKYVFVKHHVPQLQLTLVITTSLILNNCLS